MHEGILGDFSSHLPLTCSTAGATTFLLSPDDVSSYYLVVPTNGDVDGSYGNGNEGAERPASALACRSRLIAACP